MLNNSYAQQHVGHITQKRDVSTLLSTHVFGDWDAIQRIREKSVSLGMHSLTSEQYQNDILDACFRLLSVHSGPIVEIGTFKGGLSCQLAYLAEKYDRQLIFLDISPEYIEITKNHLQEQGFNSTKQQFIVGTVKDLFEQVDFHKKPPCFIAVDADHTYRGARTDLCTILYYAPNVPAIGFHDYGVKSDERMQMEHPNGSNMIVYGVYKAILDIIGNDNALHPIGRIVEKDKENYGSDCQYMIAGEPEGVLLFPALLDRVSFMMATAFVCSDFRLQYTPTPPQPYIYYNELVYAFRHSRWIKLGRKLGFLKSVDISKF